MTVDSGPGRATAALGIAAGAVLIEALAVRAGPLVAPHGLSAATLAAPAIFLAIGRLAAAETVLGVRRAAFARALLSFYAVLALARFLFAAVVHGDFAPAFAGAMATPGGLVAALPGLAVCLLATPWLMRLKPMVAVGIAIGLLLVPVETGLPPLDQAGMGLAFFLVGLGARAQIDRLVAALAAHPLAAAAAAGTAILLVLAAWHAGIGLAAIAGPAGAGAALAAAALLAERAPGAFARWLGRNWLVLIMALELPLALIDPAGGALPAPVVAALALALAATGALAVLAERAAGGGPARATKR